MDSRDAFARIAPHMQDSDFSPVGQFWWKLTREWYEADRAALCVDREAIADRAAARSTGKQRDAVLGMLRDSCISSLGSGANIAQTALELKRHNVGMELAAAIAAGDGKKQLALTQRFLELQQATELRGNKKAAVSYEWAPPIDELVELVGDANRVPLAPSRLNQRIDGGALPSTHILLFARPEMGKSTFCVNFSVQLAKRDKRVLYISNEDSVAKLKQRALARGSGMTMREAIAERNAEAVGLYKERGLEERLGFLKMTHASVPDLRRPVEEFEPDVLVLDQIRNLAGNGEVVQRLDENGQLFRELLGEYNLIGLSVAQASAGAAGKIWLEMDDLDSSKTGLPASADLMIGMGGDDSMLARGQRALSIVKNKLSSDGSSKEGIQVEIDHARVSIK